MVMFFFLRAANGGPSNNGAPGTRSDVPTALHIRKEFCERWVHRIVSKFAAHLQKKPAAKIGLLCFITYVSGKKAV